MKFEGDLMNDFPLDFFIKEDTKPDINTNNDKVKNERTIFNIFKSLSETKQLEVGDLDIYNPVLINKMFSKFPDTLFIANNLNGFFSLPNEAQIDFLLLTVVKRNRFYRWPKKIKNDLDEDLERIATPLNIT